MASHSEVNTAKYKKSNVGKIILFINLIVNILLLFKIYHK
jgi:hypothetical protein